MARAYELVLTTLVAVVLTLSLGAAALSPASADQPDRIITRAAGAAQPSAPAAVIEPVAPTPVIPADTLPERHVEVGEATWYGDEFHGRTTASGELMDQEALIAAHPTLPFGTQLRVTNQHNGKSVVVRVVDRGPNAPGLVLPAVVDLSRAAAREIDMLARGRVFVTVEVLTPPDR